MSSKSKEYRVHRGPIVFNDKDYFRSYPGRRIPQPPIPFRDFDWSGAENKQITPSHMGLLLGIYSKNQIKKERPSIPFIPIITHALFSKGIKPVDYLSSRDFNPYGDIPLYYSSAIKSVIEEFNYWSIGKEDSKFGTVYTYYPYSRGGTVKEFVVVNTKWPERIIDLNLNSRSLAAKRRLNNYEEEAEKESP